MTITGKQIAMARILLDLSQEELANKISIARKTIMRIESGQSPGSSSNMDKIQTFLEGSGIVFLEQDGIKKTNHGLRTLIGRDGFKAFRSDVYQTFKEHGGIALVNKVDERKFTSVLNAEEEKEYFDNMSSVNNLDFKILCEEGDYNFYANIYAEYRWTPKAQFATVPFYLYNDKLAVILFEDPVIVTIIENKELARAYRLQFMQMWNQALIPPPQKRGAKP